MKFPRFGRSRIVIGSSLALAALTASVIIPAVGQSQTLPTPVAGGQVMQPGPAPIPVGTVHTLSAVGPNIIGGHPAASAPPWIAQMMMNWQGDPNSPQCTAELVANDVVRTNAHCVTDDNGNPVDPAKYGFHVLIGSLCTPDDGGTPPRNACATMVDKTTAAAGIDLPVTRIVSVPGWDWGALDSAGRVDDDALLFLGGTVPNTPVELASHDAHVGTPVVQYGYGRNNPSNQGPEPGLLYELTGNTIASARPCDTNPDFPMGKGEICVTANNFTGACGGDSGGPVMEHVAGRDVAAGGTSRSPGMLPGCGGEADIYTDLSYFGPWERAVEAGIDPVTALNFVPGGAGPHPGVHHGPVSASVLAVQQRWQAAFHHLGS